MVNGRSARDRRSDRQPLYGPVNEIDTIAFEIFALFARHSTIRPQRACGRPFSFCLRRPMRMSGLCLCLCSLWMF